MPRASGGAATQPRREVAAWPTLCRSGPSRAAGGEAPPELFEVVLVGRDDTVLDGLGPPGAYSVTAIGAATASC